MKLELQGSVGPVRGLFQEGGKAPDLEAAGATRMGAHTPSPASPVSPTEPLRGARQFEGAFDWVLSKTQPASVGGASRSGGSFDQAARAIFTSGLA